MNLEKFYQLQANQFRAIREELSKAEEGDKITIIIGKVEYTLGLINKKTT